jgi:predicted Rossmann-fold nucleotide-binding protein
VNVAIVGSRDYKHLERVRAYVRTLPPDTVVISGGARGVDSVAEQAAREAGLEVLVLYPEWDRLGKAAGFARNKEIVQRADKIVAFYNGISKGTAHTLGLARIQHKPYTIILDEEDE